MIKNPAVEESAAGFFFRIAKKIVKKELLLVVTGQIITKHRPLLIKALLV